MRYFMMDIILPMLCGFMVGAVAERIFGIPFLSFDWWVFLVTLAILFTYLRFRDWSDLLTHKEESIRKTYSKLYEEYISEDNVLSDYFSSVNPFTDIEEVKIRTAKLAKIVKG